MRRLRSAVTALLLTVGATAAVTVAATPAQAAPIICEKFGGTYIQSNTLRVQNNVWGADTPQCIDVNQNGGFTITQAGHSNATNGAPAAYPSIYAGCHWAQCTSGSGLPMQTSASGFDNIETSVSMTYPSSGTWNAAYDLWFDPTPRTDGQNTGAEMMIWLNRQGSIQPIGSPVDTVNLAGGTWQVWFGNIGWNVVTYLRTSPTSSLNFAVDTFYSDAVSRGYAQRSWYLTSVQAGFEPWIGGTGLTVNSFSYTTNGDGGGGGGGGDTTPPSTPQNLTVTGTTASSVSLSWSPSNDNVGVTGYNVFRRQGTSGSFGQVGSTSGTSFTSSGLSANTQYQFFVVAEDAADNTSGNSATVSATTTGGGGGGGDGDCSVNAIAQSAWSTGYVMQVTVTNTGDAPISGWTVTGTLPSGHQIGGPWGAVRNGSGQNLVFVNEVWNGNLAPNQSTQFGFQASRPSGNTQLPSGFSCSAS
jgi:chitodextrinase